MMIPVTYSLSRDLQNSDTYYRRVRAFTDEVIGRASESLRISITEFKEYILASRAEEIRTDEEYVLDLLSFGLFWKSYAGYVLAIRRAPFLTMARMAEWRKRHQKMKPAIDLVRGVLATLFLLPQRGEGPTRSLPTLREVDRLNRWLAATGEFHEQALRFRLWRTYWESMPASRWTEGAAAVLEFSDWFIRRSEETLGGYTANVDGFLEKSQNRYRWREDRVQCTRPRPEYHLNMVGAEIMNRAFRTDFKRTETKAVLVPGCMRGRPGGECKAKRVREGLRCTGCLPDCRVNQLREMGLKQDFGVLIIPHASDLTLWSPVPGQSRRGVVAVACVPTLVEGGWELKRYGVPAQCVLLDYSGCRKHWHPEGVPTSLNMGELRRILEGTN